MYKSQVSGERLQDHWSCGFKLILHPFQDYFSSFETGQLVGGRKWDNPRENTAVTPASRTCLVSQLPSAGLEPTPNTALR